MGVMTALAKMANYIPTISKPVQKPSLYRRLAWTGIVLVIYLIMANTPLYGIHQQGQTQIELQRIIFASKAGTLMELGIGPIVTAGLILQVLVGAKIIDMDLTDPDDKRTFTAAQKTLAVLFGLFEASMYVLGCRYWTLTPGASNPITGCTAPWTDRVLVIIQLSLATFIVILMDEMLQKGWGIGSAISLFILAGVAETMMWSLLGFVPGTSNYYGFIPALFKTPFMDLIVRPHGFPDLTGLIFTLGIILLLVYTQSTRVEIPITSQRMRGIRSKIPLQFMYVTNIPVLLLGIAVADLQLLRNLSANVFSPDSTVSRVLQDVVYYLSPPRGVLMSIQDPVKTLVFALSWVLISILFGFMWVEIAGLNPSKQAENLVKSGMEIPGMRRNPKIIERVLAKYIYPLTLLSSILVGLIAVTADIFGAYGSGTGILLAVGIIYQYYTMISYERALETYPLLRRLLGEE
ncbi:MAG: preprotein translocase subunit SecY [Desulfurococcales archaeon]|nr:preprotein translocase subunit SecY [Desulfurococcales archaeon]